MTGREDRKTAVQWTAGDFPSRERESGWLPHALLAAVVLFFSAAALWAAVSEVDEVTRGDGKVITRSQVQLVQNLEGGILAQILVQEGDLVEKDQVLIRIDPIRFKSAFREVEQGSLALKARIARLSAEADRSRFDMPAEVGRGAPGLAAQQQALFEARQKELSSRNDILRQQLMQRQNELTEYRNRAERMKEALELVRKEISLTAPLARQGVVSDVEVLRLEREASRVRTELEAASLAAPRVQAAIEEAKQKMADNELAFRSTASRELAEARAELAKLSETIPALQDRVSRTTVRSPLKGFVKSIPNKTIGGVVQPGSTMAEVVPFEDTLLVETRLRPADIAFVKPEQTATVKISAYDYSIYGGLPGKIEYVSADSIQPQQGEPFYIAHVRTNANTLEYLDRQLPVIPGMTASVDILTGRRTVLHYLLKPVNKTLERALRER